MERLASERISAPLARARAPKNTNARCSISSGSIRRLGHLPAGEKNMLARVIVVVFGISVLFLLFQNVPGRAQDPLAKPVKVSPADVQFVVDAARSGYHEVQMGKLGVERGGHDVQVYAQRILDDHTLSNAEVEALARLKSITLPDASKTDPSTANLSRLSGIEFDREFARAAVEDHLRDLAEFENEDQSAASDSDIRGFAHSMLPKLH